MAALGGLIDDVEMERRGLVSEFHNVGGARVRSRRLDEVDERHRREHAAVAVGARRNGRRFQACGNSEQRGRLDLVETDLVLLFVDDAQRRPGHAVDGSG